MMLKISGEALEGDLGFGIDPKVLRRISKEVAEASKSGVEIAMVVGGGNFFRGVNRWDGLDRPTADYVGMLATVMNALTLQSALESEGVEVRLYCATDSRCASACTLAPQISWPRSSLSTAATRGHSPRTFSQKSAQMHPGPVCDSLRRDLLCVSLCWQGAALPRGVAMYLS